jgi:hypothetical protein
MHGLSTTTTYEMRACNGCFTGERMCDGVMVANRVLYNWNEGMHN